MNITREQVADLRVGDVVEITEIDDEGNTYTYRGPVKADLHHKEVLNFSDFWLRDQKGNPGPWIDYLTVVSRAPRPLYVNHDRAEPVAGDVVRDADRPTTKLWVYQPIALDRDHRSFPWVDPSDLSAQHLTRDRLPTHLSLLVDGATGQVVP